jgi:hypothetical protein
VWARATQTQTSWDTRWKAATKALDKLQAAFFGNELLVPAELDATKDAPDFSDG